MLRCGFKGCPADATFEIKNICDYVSLKNGGHGAVRDILEHVLKHIGKWDNLLKHYGVM
jgi:3-deoxy-D-manno-octulosonate 8-phosphate phosphatase (KDO 8-P phosphatase)